MPRAVETKVGTRNREKSAHTIVWLIDDEPIDQGLWFDILLDESGDYFPMVTGKGIKLDEGIDYKVVDSDGNDAELKSAPEKVRKLIVVELANRLNVPTSVKLPETGQNVSAKSRNWVALRARMDSPFLDSAALIEYVEKNDGLADIASDTVEVETSDTQELASA